MTNHMAQGGRDHRIHEFRGRPERRNSPRRRYSPDRDTRGHLFRNKMPPRSRGSSQSRSPIRKSERRSKKEVDGEKSDSSGSFNTSENEDRKKDNRHSSSDEKDEKDDGEAQLKQIALDMKALHEDKSKLQMILDEKIDEAGILSGRVDDLESQLNKEKEDCERMTSKIKKLIKAYGRYVKAQDDLKRSQGRFERLADSLASDSLKSGTKEQGSSVNAGNDDPYNAYEMSPDDQRQKNGSAARKRSAALSTSEEEKTGKKRRVNGNDMIHVPRKHIPGGALESLKNSNGTESLKKLGEDDNNDEINVISSGNDFTDRYNGNEEDDPVDL
ncbi:zinc finger CCCH domain-containing protein 13-like isoform X3 [Triticum dicoccoides]|uniref:zinc finger CCCH domain-containing protein 13-like isoform X3 n=1 Tax=Triticum dicoccoides TaxID=85692 RepID=UPI000E7CCE1D|nr:zinc finger CCCH domain-containing protein 13-like isoform X3 [Triticum dicoccoides]XP_044430899.1 zinc finger CCCH domain-containing protein 13-like isoform X3 [Triticum aestivum]